MQQSQASSRFRAPWIIFWVAFGLRVACIAIGHTYRVRVIDNHFDFGFEAGRIAKSLVEGHGYGNPFNGWSGPTTWLPPLYPLLLALAFKLFGVYTNAAAFFVMVVDSLFSAAIVPAVYEIAARCFDAGGFARRNSSRAAPVALWSAWMWAVYPAALQYAVHWIWEMSLSAFLFTWALVFALRLRGIGDGEERAGSGQRLRWAAFGALWGLVALSNATLLLCFPAAALWILWPQFRARASMRRSITGPLLAAVLFCVVMTPWWIRNEFAMHTFIATRGNFPQELWQSTRAENGSLPWGTAMPLWPGDPQFQLYVHMGEVRFMKMRKEQAIASLRAHPGRLVRHSIDRFFFFWDGTPHPPDRHPWLEYGRVLSHSFLSLCGLLGLGLALRRRVPGTVLMAWAFILAPLPYYFVTVQPRFRHPIEPLIAILGVYLFRSTGSRTRASA